MKVVWSLFDGSGIMGLPWAKAGYQVYCFNADSANHGEYFIKADHPNLHYVNQWIDPQFAIKQEILGTPLPSIIFGFPDCTLTLLKGNEGKPWSPVERAVIYGRFRSYGMSVEQIATQVGKTVQHVYEQLNILDMPLELKRRIQNGEISASAAIRQFKAGDKEPVVTRRPPAKLVRSAVEAIRGEWSVTRSEGGKVLVELTAEQFEALKALKEHQL